MSVPTTKTAAPLPRRWLADTTGRVNVTIFGRTPEDVRAMALTYAVKHGTPIRICWGNTEEPTMWVNPDATVDIPGTVR